MSLATCFLLRQSRSHNMQLRFLPIIGNNTQTFSELSVSLLCKISNKNQAIQSWQQHIAPLIKYQIASKVNTFQTFLLLQILSILNVCTSCTFRLYFKENLSSAAMFPNYPRWLKFAHGLNQRPRWVCRTGKPILNNTRERR